MAFTGTMAIAQAAKAYFLRGVDIEAAKAAMRAVAEDDPQVPPTA